MRQPQTEVSDNRLQEIIDETPEHEVYLLSALKELVTLRQRIADWTTIISDYEIESVKLFQDKDKLEQQNKGLNTQIGKLKPLRDEQYKLIGKLKDQNKALIEDSENLCSLIDDDSEIPIDIHFRKQHKALMEEINE